jgi:hypothetical protein
MWFFVQECAAELPILSPVKIIFQKFSFFYRYCRRFGCALYFVRTLYFERPLYAVYTVSIECVSVWVKGRAWGSVGDHILQEFTTQIQYLQNC